MTIDDSVISAMNTTTISQGKPQKWDTGTYYLDDAGELVELVGICDTPTGLFRDVKTGETRALGLDGLTAQLFRWLKPEDVTP